MQCRVQSAPLNPAARQPPLHRAAQSGLRGRGRGWLPPVSSVTLAGRQGKEVQIDRIWEQEEGSDPW